MYALCVSGTVNRQAFVSKVVVFMRHVLIFYSTCFLLCVSHVKCLLADSR